MKKLFTFILVTIVTITACTIDAKAQWEPSVCYKEDELKDGISSFYSTTYTDDNGSFDCHTNSNENTIFVKPANGVFDYGKFTDNIENNVKTEFVIDFYKDITLLERKTVSLPVSEYGAIISNYNAKGLPDKILNHLINVGDVHIIAPLSSGGVFAITIPMNPDIKLLTQVSKGHWSSMYLKGDEFKGTSSSCITTYTDYNVSFICISNNEMNVLWVTLNNDIFCIDLLNKNNENIKNDDGTTLLYKVLVSPSIDFYKDGKLIDCETTAAYAKSFSAAFISNDEPDDKLVDKILNHLMNVGDIRITIFVQPRKDLDVPIVYITIPMNPDIKLLKQVSSGKSAK